MKVDYTSIIKSKSHLDAIVEMINETFNSKIIDKMTENLQTIECNESNGMYISKVFNEAHNYTTTYYFIVTKLPGELLRVEECSDTEYHEK